MEFETYDTVLILVMALWSLWIWCSIKFLNEEDTTPHLLVSLLSVAAAGIGLFSSTIMRAEVETVASNFFGVYPTDLTVQLVVVNTAVFIAQFVIVGIIALVFGISRIVLNLPNRPVELREDARQATNWIRGLTA